MTLPPASDEAKPEEASSSDPPAPDEPAQAVDEAPKEADDPPADAEAEVAAAEPEADDSKPQEEASEEPAAADAEASTLTEVVEKLQEAGEYSQTPCPCDQRLLLLGSLRPCLGPEPQSSLSFPTLFLCFKLSWYRSSSADGY